ncbi:TolC family outer membrane protein [Sulfuricurvum sp.]|uniref:TolC family outer membrane protein n=1 Tax=Sulfuricurvum sp. TaxID=2025608 RepID=UPI0026339202|nr:TolC family outer membrane protein [Sulfuricurvum sp.]MDD2267400.1 TolC family outer membrane protein [Sulfuricurvum sp.]MDD2783079.1 TolC family outer membrane protein [Sulfuricurvum sp.]
MWYQKIPFSKAAVTFTLSVCAASALNALSLQEGVDEALATHPVVQERLHNYRATLEDLRTTEAQYLPTLDYTGTISRDRTDSPNTRAVAPFGSRSLTSYEHSLILTQNLFNGFGTQYEVDMNKARILAAANHYIENANDVAYNFVYMYITSLKNRDLLCIAKANVDFNQEIYDKVNKLYQAGLTTRSESEKADTSLSLAKSNYVVAQNNLDDSLFNLERVLGRHVTIEELQDAHFMGQIPSTLEEMKEYARTHNPSVMVNEYNIKAAKAQKEASQKNYYPKIDAFVRQSWANDVGGVDGKDDRFRVGLTLSYNLYHGGADESQIQKNLSKIYQESETKRDTIRKLDEQGELSWSAKTHLKDQLQHLKRYEATSAKTLELYQKEYDLGRRTLLDLIVAQNDHVAAESQIVRAENDLLFSYYRILDAMGSMVQNVLGSKTEEYTNKVGLKVLDNRLDNDGRVDTLIFADRKNDPYTRDENGDVAVLPSVGRQ